MSRIGKKIISLPKDIEASIINSVVKIKGSKGELSYKMCEVIKAVHQNNTICLHLHENSKEAKKLYGLSRTIINNMVIGVSQGFNKQLEIKGVGYRCQMDGNNLILNLGYSHSIRIKPPEKIKIQVENNLHITVSGINKETVGLIAAKIRKTRPLEPYKGKGIKYIRETIKRKVGKAGK
ncbi:50S ribosomal protein L6 [Bacillus paranthracis]|uniref:50S ribosomal protein L6 n=1 Tax=Bacillus paranthracis TaxID=2026186 RepID=UPI003D65BDA1